MIRAALTTLAVLAAAPCLAQPVEVPSGQQVEYVEVIRDARGPRGLTWRFRFVAPAIKRKGTDEDFSRTAADMDHLCAHFALPRLPALEPRPNQIIISLSDRPVEFGTANPEITQFFEAYKVEAGTCIWDGF